MNEALNQKGSYSQALCFSHSLANNLSLTRLWLLSIPASPP